MNKKMLLVSITIFLLTGCGGGGGGGGNSDSTSSTTSTVTVPTDQWVVVEEVIGLENENSSDITDSSTGKVGMRLKKENSSYTGTMTLTGDNAVGILGKAEDENKRTNEGRSARATKYSFENHGTITLSGRNSIGIYVDDGYIATNVGTINLNSRFIDDEKLNVDGVLNSEEVIFQSNGTYAELFGMMAILGGEIENAGDILLYGKGTGMAAYTGSVARNTGNIKMTSPEMKYSVYTDTEASTETIMAKTPITGMYGYGSGTKIYNEAQGNISMSGYAKGMHADYGAEAINRGTIEVDGAGSWGMYATNGSTITNEGTINVGITAAGGMYADSTSTAKNTGKIYIDPSNTTAVALGGAGNLTDNGTVIRSRAITIENYVVGTTENGDYGQISATNVEVDGTIQIENNLARGGYAEEYLLENIVEAKALKIGENFALTTDTVLYDAEAITSEEGKLDAKLVRNTNQMADFVPQYLKGTAEIFGAYQNSEKFTMLSEDAKEVLNSIELKNSETITRDLDKFIPSIYANIGREIYDVATTFAEQENKIGEGIGKERTYWTLFGNYSKVDSRNRIEGYKSTMSGVMAGVNLGQGFVATAGYGYSDIDYKKSSSGEINTIHLGVNKFSTLEKVDLKLGLRGDYNFHENKRDISDFSRRAKSDFTSYWISGVGEVSKTYGEGLYARPFVSLEIGAGGHESFTEKRANSLDAHISSKNYSSVLPKLGMNVGAEMERINLYASADFSYELGNMDRREKFSLRGFEGIKASLPKDEIEGGTGTFKVGASYSFMNFDFNLTGGLQVGKRERKFGELLIGYKF